MRRTKKTVAIAVGGLAALLLVGSALAHPGGGLVDRVDVLARALGITADEVEQAKEDGTLRDLLADVTRDDLRTAYEEEATEAIDSASDDGEITSTQADRLKEVVSADRSDLTDDDRATLKDLRGTVTIDVTAVYASVLGIASEEVEAAKDDGTLRDQLADVNRVALVAALVDARDAAIDAAEDAGDLTTEQAELLRDAGSGLGGFRGKGRGHWGGRGFDRWSGDCGKSGEWSGDKKDATPVGDPA
ncbi:MAG: hypothetical protein F4X26_10295 [Chloroflexi bacterium]|nr:hypothetical protein [Chloroflexota bacterium]